MTKTFEERNQSSTARRKLKSLADNSGIDLELVSALANFTWDYDTEFRNESIGWVDNKSLCQAAQQQLRWISETLGLPPDFELSHEKAVNDVIRAHRDQSPELLWDNFCAAVETKNYARVSEFASHHYLRGLNDSRANDLKWSGKSVAFIDIAMYLFLKLFRGGRMERSDLAYVWCDLCLPLKYKSPKQKVSPWIEPLLSSIESLPHNSGLNDLIGCCKGLVGGDKNFKQVVLQALSYSDILRVNGIPVMTMFLSERRNDLSRHFYSNEWSFPLRFWSSNGGTVNRAAIPTPKKS